MTKTVGIGIQSFEDIIGGFIMEIVYIESQSMFVQGKKDEIFKRYD